MEAPRFDVFLSHRSADKPAVEELARRLVRKGIEPWLDKWHLVPGTPWQEAIEKALSECASVAVCIGPGGFGPWQDEEMRAAIDRRVQDRKGSFRVIPVLLPGVRREEIGPLPTFLTAATWVELRDTLDDEEAFRRLVCGILGIAPGPGPEGIVQGITPYRGLRYFDVGDALFFGGRKKLTGDLLDKLRSGDRLLAVLGASGSGKSSLIRAGLLASLKQGRISGSETWPQAIFKPGEKPLDKLVEALMTALPLTDDPIELIEKLSEDQRRLHFTVHQALREVPADRRLVLCIDQFEEIFTLCSDEAQRKALMGNLLHASSVADGRIVVLLTLRTDFFGHCSPELAASLSSHHVLVGPMTEDDLRSAIERPATLVGCELEAGLTDLLLQEIEGQPGSLPLLQHALLEIWNRRQGRRLTVEAYREIGGVRGALERHAEEVYGRFSETEQEVCRKIFLRLVQPGEETAATRRRLTLHELSGGENDTVVRRLIDARLLTTGGEENPSIELAHEALITSWKRFQDWIESGREALLVRRRLDDAVDEWIAKGRYASYLYQGGRLAQAEEWAASRPDEVNGATKAFLSASAAQRDEQYLRELVQAQALEEEQRRRAEAEKQRADAEYQRAEEKARNEAKAKRETWVLRLVCFAALFFAVYSWALERAAERQRRILLAKNLAQKARSGSSADSPVQLLLAAEAVKLLDRLGEADQSEEEEILRWILARSFGRAFESGRIKAVGTTPNLHFLVTAGTNGEAHLWDLDAKDPATSGRFLVHLDEGDVSALTMTSDRKWLLTRIIESGRSRIFLRDLTLRDGPRELPKEDWLTMRQPFSPDGQWLVTHKAGRALLRELKASVVYPLGNQGLQVATYSPDGRWLATAFKDGTAELRDLRSADPVTPVYELPGIGGRTVSLEFTPDGRQISGVGENKAQVIWSLDRTGRPGVPVHTDFKGDINFLKFLPEAREIFGILGPWRFGSYSPNGRWFITQGGNEPPRLRKNPKVLVEVEPIRSEHSWDRLLAVSSNGRFLLVHRRNQVFLLNLNDHGTEIEVGSKEPPQSWTHWTLSFDGSWIASAAASRLFVWRRTPEGFRTVLEAKRPDSFRMLALSPNNQWLVSADQSHTLLLWNLRDLKAKPKELARHLDGITALAIDATGRLLATGGRKGIVHGYHLNINPPNMQGIREPEMRDRLGNWISALAFSPDGVWLAIADRAGRIVLWRSGMREYLLPNRSEVIRRLAFSPDGRSLAGVSESGEAQLWRIEKEGKASKPVILSKSVQAIAFSSDGRLVTVSDGTVRHWETDLDKLLKLACQTVGRNLTREEWETHLPGEPYNPLEPCPNLPPGE